MSTTTPNYGTSSALTVTALQSLADGSYWQSAKQDNDSDLGMLTRYFITVLTTTTAAAAVGTLDVFVSGSVDGGTDFAGGASGSEGSYTVVGNSNEQLRLLDSIIIDATETTARTYKAEIVLANVPKDYAIVIRNNTGQALGATVNAVEKLVQKFDTA